MTRARELRGLRGLVDADGLRSTAQWAASVRIALAILGVIAGVHRPALAEVRTGEAVVVGADEIVGENLSASAANVAVHGHVQGDLVVGGGTIVVDGVVDGDVLAVGGQVTITGDVGGDVRTLAGSVIVDGPVGGDVLASGGMVTLGSTIDGDAVVGAATVKVGGAIGHDLLVAGSDTQLEGAVGGDVDARGEHLVLGDRVRVDGDLDWTGPPGVTRAPGAVVAGVYAVHPVSAPPVWLGPLFTGLQLFVGMLVVGLLWLAVFAGFATRAMQTLRERPLASLAVGVVVVVAAPILAFAVGVFGLFFGGPWLAGIFLAIFGIALSLTMPLVALALGRRLTGRDADVVGLWLPYALVLALLAAIVQVPVLGGLVAVVVVVTGLGALALTLVPTLRFTSRPGLDTVPLPPTAMAQHAE
jgi:cytoskeletal protein CcmA (bactofilin family)